MNNSQNSMPTQVVSQHPPQQIASVQNQMMQGHGNFVSQQLPPQQITPVQQQNAQQQQQQNLNQEILSKTRKLIHDLKESLATLMNFLAKNIAYNYQIVCGQKINIEKCSRFDKAWGEFNSICNQVETHFKTFQECVLLRKESRNYVPFTLSSLNQIEPHNDNQTITYSQYVNLIKNQVNYSKQIQEILTEGARKISQTDYAPVNQQQQNIHNQQQQHNYHQLHNQQQIQQHSYHSNPMMNSPINQSMNHSMNNQPINPQINQQMNQQQISQQQMIQQQSMQRVPPQINQPINPQINQQMMQQQMSTNQIPQMQQMHGQQIKQPTYMSHNQM